MTENISNKLLAWYDGCARILPWRNNPSPYRVWISEIMLQQTRVDTVVPYFEKFISEVPTVGDLAALPDDRLLKLWEGLGYYSRAMNIKKAALIIMQNFDGQIPGDIESLRSLPGVGPYSAGAIASIAFGARVPAIDGNVLRVVARITANKGDITKASVRTEIAKWLETVIPQTRAGDFNQALMELGATLCLPKDMAKCGVCLLSNYCAAYTYGLVGELPAKAEKKQRRIEKRTVAVMCDQDCIALRRRPAYGLLANLWELPNFAGHLSPQECAEKVSAWGVKVYKITPLTKAKHVFTHVEWRMVGYTLLVDSTGQDSTDIVWVTREDLKRQYSVPSAFKVYAD